MAESLFRTVALLRLGFFHITAKLFQFCSPISLVNTALATAISPTTWSIDDEFNATEFKTYCQYCKRVKQLLSQLGASYKVIELDEESDGSEIQSAVEQWTGQRTVPNVFIGGKHVGGCDAVTEKHQGGKLVPLLMDAGAIANNSAQL